MPSARAKLWTTLKPVLPTFVIVVVLEVLLRLTGVAPAGHFDFLLPTSGGGLYPPGETITNDWGKIPYVVTTDEFGLRSTTDGGPRVTAARIVTIGDSITDGFFVDDDGTYPWFLDRHLQEAHGDAYQVLNAARGGGSIDKELAILREVVLPLKPEVVVLTFVTNDIWELRKKTRPELDRYELEVHGQNVGPVRRAGLWFFTRSAVGEVIFRAWWTFVVTPGSSDDEPAPAEGDDRYAIPGGGDYEANAERFRRKFGTHDGRLMTEEFEPSIQATVANYLHVLDEFVRTCRDNGITPVFVYFPSYTQVYEPSTPTTIQEKLAERCDALSMPFLDLTDALRQHGADRVLHLAPVDYHLNPAGNEVIGAAVAEFLRPRLAGSPGRSSSPGSSSSAGD